MAHGGFAHPRPAGTPGPAGEALPRLSRRAPRPDHATSAAHPTPGNWRQLLARSWVAPSRWVVTRRTTRPHTPARLPAARRAMSCALLGPATRQTRPGFGWFLGASSDLGLRLGHHRGVCAPGRGGRGGEGGVGVPEPARAEVRAPWHRSARVKSQKTQPANMAIFWMQIGPKSGVWARAHLGVLGPNGRGG